ncbi:MAG: imidazoleglycerol-phosphate dehydratase HisB [Acidimicrobiales bacterium]|jgi:imidazoleglycerol-phosphate dehydratase
MAMNTEELKGPANRRAERKRSTKETEITLSIEIDGTGSAAVETGLPFFDHMLAQLGKHGGLNLEITARGDLEVDAHHTVEDTGIVLGEALAEALGSKAGVRRFASISLPLDEALVDVALDLSGRPYLYYEVELGETAPLGNPPFEAQLAEEFWRAFVHAAGISLHIELRRGRNPHHVLEASFKGVARALRDAVRIEGSAIPSTKGQL